MLHTLFTIPGIDYPIPAYGFFMMLGFMSGIFWGVNRAVRSGANPDVILNCGFIALVGGILGARFMFVFMHWNSHFANAGSIGELVASILNVARGGLEFYGGFIGAALGILGYLVFWGHSFRWYLDIIAPSAMLGLAFGRVGCYLNGCCWGGVCALPWAVTFPYASPPFNAHWQQALPEAAVPPELVWEVEGAHRPIDRDHLTLDEAEVAQASAAERDVQRRLAEARSQLAAADAPDRAALEQQVSALELERSQRQSLYRDVRSIMESRNVEYVDIRRAAAAHRSAPVHPTQLYSAITALILAFLLDRLYWRRSFDGQVMAMLLLIQPVTRWLLEAIRSDLTPTALGQTRSQLVAVALTLIGILAYVAFRSLPARSPRATVWVDPDKPSAEASDATDAKSPKRPESA